MSEADVFEDWIPTSEGAELTGYTAEYVRVLARTGKIEARKLSGVWLVNKDSLLQHQHDVRYGRPKETEDDDASA